MDRVGKLIESITKPRYEEDFMDRLNYRVTSYVLLLAAFTIIAKEYGGDPIQCWLPAELANQKGWEQYAKDYCFVENTYYVPLDQNIPQSSRHRSEKELTYYQWVPFLLLLQAMMFTVPHIFWRMLNWMSGIQTRAVISMAHSAAQMNPSTNEMKELVESVAVHMDKALNQYDIFRHLLHSNPIVTISRMMAMCYLTSIYIFTKFLFIGNTILQFWILSVYLGANGFEMTRALIQRQPWESTGFFPRVTMCDFKVRAIGNLHHHTIQCVLMANMFNEKIYIGLWWWILILMTLTCMNLCYWVYVINNSASKYDFLIGLVRLGEPEEKINRYRADSFVRYVSGDGILVLRLMTQNAGEIIASIVAARLYDIYCARRELENYECSKNILKGIRIPSLLMEGKSLPLKPFIPFSH